MAGPAQAAPLPRRRPPPCCLVLGSGEALARPSGPGGLGGAARPPRRLTSPPLASRRLTPLDGARAVVGTPPPPVLRAGPSCMWADPTPERLPELQTHGSLPNVGASPPRRRWTQIPVQPPPLTPVRTPSNSFPDATAALRRRQSERRRHEALRRLSGEAAATAALLSSLPRRQRLPACSRPAAAANAPSPAAAAPRDVAQVPVRPAVPRAGGSGIPGHRRPGAGLAASSSASVRQRQQSAARPAQLSPKASRAHEAAEQRGRAEVEADDVSGRSRLLLDMQRGAMEVFEEIRRKSSVGGDVHPFPLSPHVLHDIQAPPVDSGGEPEAAYDSASSSGRSTDEGLSGELSPLGPADSAEFPAQCIAAPSAPPRTGSNVGGLALSTRVSPGSVRSPVRAPLKEPCPPIQTAGLSAVVSAAAPELGWKKGVVAKVVSKLQAVGICSAADLIGADAGNLNAKLAEEGYRTLHAATVQVLQRAAAQQP
eukprot:TRINITY_DN16158_c0_g1_i2.p1 TRINITY_DN16158_c0_g1~~TRINITY_DN16158_c0_g1_i2.p1  ORF type:complete len:500 (+),score=110.95 TRINITY_DN16158_c0_g1_i2:53-1501(+)